ncbi:hypothetical protein LEMLEM_LOCUS12096, partial [Lemmus lemmus]
RPASQGGPAAGVSAVRGCHFGVGQLRQRPGSAEKGGASQKDAGEGEQENFSRNLGGKSWCSLAVLSCKSENISVSWSLHVENDRQNS